MTDCIFPTDNAYGIPVLAIERQALTLDVPCLGWGSIARTAKMPGTWHFYTDDYRFRAIINKPEQVINTGCVTCVEPNFTLSEVLPLAVALYLTYQKRWISRLWQSSGIRIIADLNVSPKYRSLNFIGIPRGWTAYATHGYSDRVEDTLEDYRTAQQHAGTNNILFLVYGGGKAVEQAALVNRWIWIPERAETIKKEYMLYAKDK